MMVQLRKTLQTQIFFMQNYSSMILLCTLLRQFNAPLDNDQVTGKACNCCKLGNVPPDSHVKAPTCNSPSSSAPRRCLLPHPAAACCPEQDHLFCEHAECAKLTWTPIMRNAPVHERTSRQQRIVKGIPADIPVTHCPTVTTPFGPPAV